MLDSSAKPKEQATKRSRKQKESTGQGDAVDAALKTKAFCISIFLQFAFEGAVSVSGKLVKAYSALRSELQQVMLSAIETFVNNGPHGAGSKVDAMEL